MSYHLSADDEAELAELNKNPIFRAIWLLGQKWAMQETDYDEDTEQQVRDGWEILLVLTAPNPELAAKSDLGWMIDEAR